MKHGLKEKNLKYHIFHFPRYMNKGLTGQEIADIVKLPPHLIDHPYLIGIIL